MKTSESNINIIKAVAKAKTLMPKPGKDGVNPHFRSKYTTLDELLRCIEPALSKNGLVMIPQLLNGENSVGCQIDLYHESGEWMKTPPFFLPAQGTAQGHGSAATYVQRYVISAFWSISAQEDDDANAAQPSVNKKKLVDMIRKFCESKNVTHEYLTNILNDNFSQSKVMDLSEVELRELYKKLNV